MVGQVTGAVLYYSYCAHPVQGDVRSGDILGAGEGVLTPFTPERGESCLSKFGMHLGHDVAPPPTKVNHSRGACVWGGGGGEGARVVLASVLHSL